MGRSPKYVENSTMYEACARTRNDDIREASELMQALFTRGTIGARIVAARRSLKKWGGNRVFEIFTGKARRIEGFELETLRAMRAAKLSADAAALAEARKAHAEFAAETERLAALCFHTDENFYRDQIEARRFIARGMGVPGTDGAGE